MPLWAIWGGYTTFWFPQHPGPLPASCNGLPRADVLLSQPRIGTRLTEFEPREVRFLLIGDYELRYEIDPLDDIWILRIWHTREWR